MKRKLLTTINKFVDYSTVPYFSDTTVLTTCKIGTYRYEQSLQNVTLSSVSKIDLPETDTTKNIPERTFQNLLKSLRTITAEQEIAVYAKLNHNGTSWYMD